MKKTISILSVFTVSFFYSQDNNNDIKNENENQIISKKDFNFDYDNKNIIKIENKKVGESNVVIFDICIGCRYCDRYTICEKRD